MTTDTDTLVAKPTLEIVIRGREEAVAYACGACGKMWTTKIYACRDDLAHETARRAADECCAPRFCACGAAVERPWTACRPCRLREKLARCTIVTDYNGPVEADSYAGGWGEGYFADVADLLESCKTHEVEPPAYCHPCNSEPLRLDLDRILENACEEQHEDAHDQIVGAEELGKAVDAFNAAQTCITYYADHSRVIVLDQERFAALASHDKRKEGR